MNQKARWLLYWAQQLGYLTKEQAQNLLPGEGGMETSLPTLLSETQMSHVRFLFLKHCLLQGAKQNGYVTETQFTKLLQDKVAAVKRGEQFLSLSCLENGLVPPEFCKNTIEKLWQQGVLSDTEYQTFRTIFAPFSWQIGQMNETAPLWEAAVSSPETQGQNQREPSSSPAALNPSFMAQIRET